MQHARRSRKLPPAPDLAGVIEAAEDTRTRIEQALDQIGYLASRPYAPGVFAGLNAGLRQAGAELSGYVGELSRIQVEQALNDMEAAVERGAGFRQGAAARGGGRHASRPRRPGRGHLAVISGGAVAAGLVAGTVGTGGFSDLANLNPVPVAHHGAAGLPAPGLSGAVPITVPPVQQGYVPKHARAAAEASAASRVPTSAPSVVVLAPPPPSQAQPTHAPAAPSGTLDVATVTCVASAGAGCQIVFTAAGGPVDWAASSSSPALNLSDNAGTLRDGQPGILTVTVAPGTPAGTGVVTFTAGDQQENVQVRWDPVPG